MVSRLPSRQFGAELSELISPLRKFYPYGRFIEEHSSLSCPELFQLLSEEGEKGNVALSGVLEIEEVFSKDGRRLFLVTLDEEQYPPNFLKGPGVAYIRKGIAFVCSGYSEGAHEMICAHELYHLEHGLWTQEVPWLLRKPLMLIHEIQTIIMANLLKDPINSARVPLESFVKLPKKIRRYVSHAREQIGNVLESMKG